MKKNLVQENQFPYVLDLPDTCFKLEIKRECDLQEIMEDIKLYTYFFNSDTIINNKPKLKLIK